MCGGDATFRRNSLTTRCRCSQTTWWVDVSRVRSNVVAVLICRPSVLSVDGQTDRQTDRQTDYRSTQYASCVVTDDVVGRCQSCAVECRRCTDLPSVCTQCVDGLELFSHRCIVPCAAAQFRADDGRFVSIYLFSLFIFCIYLTLMVGRQEGQSACIKNWVIGCWRGYLSGSRCRLAYGPADTTATHCPLLK